MKIFARRSLVRNDEWTGDSLLLEGSWPQGPEASCLIPRSGTTPEGDSSDDFSDDFSVGDDPRETTSQGASRIGAVTCDDVSGDALSREAVSREAVSREAVSCEAVSCDAISGDAVTSDDLAPFTGPVTDRWSLDDLIDAEFAWIDREAVQLASQLAQGGAAALEGDGPWPMESLAYLNALDLRYYLVRLLRLVAFFRQVRPPRSGETLELFAHHGRDEDYVDLLSEISNACGCRLQVYWKPTAALEKDPPPRNRIWRRWAARLQRWTVRQEPPIEEARQPVLLCGSPDSLNPVCEELRRRDLRVHWLYDRFALGTWRRWRHEGALQWICNGAQGRRNDFAPVEMARDVESREILLEAPLRGWFESLRIRQGPLQTRWIHRLKQHFQSQRPRSLLLDQDATPFARAALAVARHHNVPSSVVQHGAPYVRFGFAPLEADQVLVWNDATAQRLRLWDVPPGRIRVTGSPRQDQLVWDFQTRPVEARPLEIATAGRRRVVLLATVPPRDDRPDAVEFHWTRSAEEQLLRTVCRSVAQMDDTELIVRLHPRAEASDIWRQLAGEFPSLKLIVQQRGDLVSSLMMADCVLSCASSAGVEATRVGLPVIQLVPEGSDGLLPAEAWGFVGTASSAQRLTTLLRQVLESDSAESQATQVPHAPQEFQQPEEFQAPQTTQSHQETQAPDSAVASHSTVANHSTPRDAAPLSTEQFTVQDWAAPNVTPPHWTPPHWKPPHWSMAGSGSAARIVDALLDGTPRNSPAVTELAAGSQRDEMAHRTASGTNASNRESSHAETPRAVKDSAHAPMT